MLSDNSAYPPTSVRLEGEHVILEPLQPAHLEGLREATVDGELWKLWYTMVPSPDGMEAWLDKALGEQSQQTCLPFAVLRKSDGKVEGSTRYMHIEKNVRRLEIGSTWYAQSVQRTALNTECKLLLLGHAFEQLACVAVEFRTHRMNTKSRAAIERLGARLDGILRNHSLMHGIMRDTAVYSVLNTEWPMVKRNLESKLGRWPGVNRV